LHSNRNHNLFFKGFLPYQKKKSFFKITKLGNDIQIAVTPTLTRTKKGAKRRFNPVRRQCYFEEEISLAHFPVEDSYRSAFQKQFVINEMC
jgi:hypothetical protein